MIEKNSVDVERIALGSTDIETVYQGTDKIWELAPKYLNYTPLCDTAFVKPMSFWMNVEVEGTPSIYNDSSATTYPGNIRYYKIGSDIEDMNIENNGVNKDIDKILVPGSKNAKPIYNLNIYSLYDINNLKDIRLKKDIYLDEDCLGDKWEYKQVSVTEETFSSDTYYELFKSTYSFSGGNPPIYIKATAYNPNTTYYQPTAVVNKLHITEYSSAVGQPNIKIKYARLGDNDYAICLGLTGESEAYMLENYSVAHGSVTIVLHEDCKYVYTNAFYNYKTPNYSYISNQIGVLGLTSARGLIQICSGAFRECAYITGYDENHYKFDLPNSIRWIGDRAFYKSISYTEQDVYQDLTLPSNIEYIGNSAFESCKNLIGLTIHPKNNSCIIKRNAFKNCTSLEYVDLEDVARLDTNETKNTILELESNIFYNCTSLKFATQPVKTFNKSYYQKTYQEINPNTTSPIDLKDCYLGTCLIYGRYRATVNYGYIIQSGTTHIAGKAFVSSISSEDISISAVSGIDIVLPSSLISIGEFAFGVTGNNQWSAVSSLLIDGMYTQVTPVAYQGEPIKYFVKLENKSPSNGTYAYIGVAYAYIQSHPSATYCTRDDSKVSLKRISTGAFNVFSNKLFGSTNSRYKYINICHNIKDNEDYNLPILYNESVFTDNAWKTNGLKFFIDSDIYTKLYNKLTEHSKNEKWNVWNNCNFETNAINLLNTSSWMYTEMFDLPMGVDVIRSSAFGNGDTDIPITPPSSNSSGGILTEPDGSGIIR